ncbi:MAG: glycosyltransferase [Terriglobia bacterium]|jgi:glycosyltransferase involved in cell wall biosynthesis
MTFERSVLIYRDELLGASETFIPAQAESLNHFRPFYLGLRQIPGLPLPEDRFHFISRSGLAGKGARVRFKLLGPSMALRRKLLDLSPVLVHAHFAPDACHVLALARALQVPLVASFHGYDLTVHDDHQTSLYLWRREKLKAQGSRFLCVSNFIHNRALEKGFPAEKTVVHYTGIDVDFFHPDPHIKRSPIVLFVGRLVPKKGCEYLVRAMADIQRVAPETKLMIIGDGPLRGALQELAAATVKHFEFLGAQKPAVVREQMNRATVFCTPSVVSETGDAEGFGMVFAEAQAMGLPVVSFDCASLPEAVADGETGFLVPERDWQTLAAKILLLLRDEDLWTRFSRAGESRIRWKFDIRKQAQALEVIYEQVIDEYCCARKPVKSRAWEIPALGGTREV